MVEHTRRHDRLPKKDLPGLHFTLSGMLPQPVEVFVPEKHRTAKQFDLLLHFHGAAFIVEQAAEQYHGALVAATINLGAGSSVYNQPFVDSTFFAALVDTLQQRLTAQISHPVTLQKIILSGFSAGYGAIRRILSFPNNYERISAVLLLDGLHASYVPEGKVLAEGGEVNRKDLESFIMLACDTGTHASPRKFLITHSEIFPGTYVSTTEATDFILQELGQKRQAVLQWGPSGMQQISAARMQHFEVRGFAGNSAPDHVDHLHGLGYFLNRLMKL